MYRIRIYVPDMYCIGKSYNMKNEMKTAFSPSVLILGCRLEVNVKSRLKTYCLIMLSTCSE